MNRISRTIAVLAVTLCAMSVAGALLPAVAGAQGAADEYNLDVPGKGGQTTTPTHTSDSDSGGFPVIIVVLIVVAGAAAGFAAWRLRKPNEPGSGPPEDDSAAE